MLHCLEDSIQVKYGDKPKSLPVMVIMDSTWFGMISGAVEIDDKTGFWNGTDALKYEKDPLKTKTLSVGLTVETNVLLLVSSWAGQKAIRDAADE